MEPLGRWLGAWSTWLNFLYQCGSRSPGWSTVAIVGWGSHVHKWRSLDLGVHPTIGREAHLTVSVEPNPADHAGPFVVENDAREWCVSLHVEGRLPNESDVEVAVIDTRHGQLHLDRYFTASGPDEQDKAWLDGWTYAEARRLLLANWEEYVDRYVANHGRP